MPEIKTSGELFIDRASNACGKPVSIYLANGVKLDGVLTEVLPDAITLTKQGVTQLIQVCHVATILPTDGNFNF